MPFIHKEVYGQGEPLVLIHGWAMHSGIWREFAQQLSQYYKVICLDLPGHGLSHPIYPYTLDLISETLIDTIADDSFTLLGWSLGASVALTMAKQYPQRVDTLIMVAGNPQFVQSDNWPGMKSEILNDFAMALSNNCKATLLRFLSLQVKNSAERKTILKQLKIAINEQAPPTEFILQGGLAILSNDDIREYFPLLNCPVKIILGDKDTLVPVQVRQSMLKLHPAADVHIMPGAGHVPFLSHQSQMIELIREFV